MRRSRSPRNRIERGAEETFSISSLSDAGSVNGNSNNRSGFSRFDSKSSERRKRHSRDRKNNQGPETRFDKRDDKHRRFPKDTEYLHFEQNSFFPGNRAQMEIADPSICDFQGAPRPPSPMTHNEPSYIPSKRAVGDIFNVEDRRPIDDRLNRGDRRHVNERERGDRKVIDRQDRGDKRSISGRDRLLIDVRSDSGDRRVSDERIDHGERRFIDSRSEHKERPVDSRSDQAEGKPDERINRLEKMVELLVQNKSQPQALPSFVPPQEISQGSLELVGRNLNVTTSVWLNKVNEECLDRNFDEVTCINFIQTKMTGLMKAWFKTLNPYEYTWPELKMLITKTFPDTYDFATTLRMVVNRMKRPDETVTQYYFAKMYLVEFCKISGSNAVSCLIDGLGDPFLQRQATEFNFLTPETLYSQYLVKIPNFGLIPQHFPQQIEPEPMGMPEMEFSEQDAFYSQPRQEHRRAEKDSSKKKCFTCGKVGHIAENCRHAPVCYRCRQHGHIAVKCPVYKA